MSQSLMTLVSALLVASHAVNAIGDFPCKGTNSSMTCAQWSTYTDAQGTITADAVCQPGMLLRPTCILQSGRRVADELLASVILRLPAHRSRLPVDQLLRLRARSLLHKLAVRLRFVFSRSA